MQISELSLRTGVPIGTIKFYLREKLLATGTVISATRAEYSEAHVDRLNLLRVLLGVGGLSVSRARQVLAALDAPPVSIHEVLQATHAALGPHVAVEERQQQHARDLVRRWGWSVLAGGSAIDQLAAAVGALETAGFPELDVVMDRYALAMRELAAADVAGVPNECPTAAVRYLVIGTVLLEPLIAALRRLAQEDAAAQRPRSTAAERHSTEDRGVS